MVPSNVVGAAAKFDMFGVIFFTLAFGAALTRVSGPARYNARCDRSWLRGDDDTH